MDWPRSSRFLIISRVAILKEILTYLGTLLTSNTLKELYELLGINWASAQTTVYHPQSDGLMERLNKSLKSMIHNFIHEDERNWVTGYTVCCLQCGRCPRNTGILSFCVLQMWPWFTTLTKHQGLKHTKARWCVHGPTHYLNIRD